MNRLIRHMGCYNMSTGSNQFASTLHPTLGSSHSHKPQIDPHSDHLARIKYAQRTQAWEYLYSLASKRRQRRKLRCASKKAMEEEECARECTFRPRICGRGAEEAGVEWKESGDVYARCVQWMRSRDEK